MRRSPAWLFLLLTASLAFADDAKKPFWIEEVNGIRVAHCAGDPAVWGKAYGAAMKDEIQGLYHQYVEASATPEQMKAAEMVVKVMASHIPEDYLGMVHAVAEGSGLTDDQALTAQCYADLLQMLGCSTFVALGDASADGKPIFGRNLDYPTNNVLQSHHLVTVYHRDGGSFLTVGFPGMLGAASGMNDRGLAIAVMNVFSSKPNPDGMPYLLMFRRILETCSTVDEAVEVVKKTPRTAPNNLMVCDAKGAAVIEFSPTDVAVRRPAEGRLWSTNHFESESLANRDNPGEPTTCERYRFLKEHLSGKVGVEEGKKLLAGVADHDMTLQSMIFRPATVELWLSCGKVPATEGEYERLDAKELFGAK